MAKGFDARVRAQKALQLAKERFERELAAMAERDPVLFRMGSNALLEPVMTSKDKTAVRREFDRLATQDPMGYEAALQKTIAERGFQPTLDLLDGGRQAPPEEEETGSPFGSSTEEPEQEPMTEGATGDVY